MLEDLKPEISALKQKLDEMGTSLDINTKEQKIAELEYKMGEPTFWDNAEEAQRINKELGDIKGTVDKYKSLESKIGDTEAMWELGMEEGSA